MSSEHGVTRTAEHVILMLHALRLEALNDVAIDRLGATAKLRWIARERASLPWEHRVAYAHRVRLLLLTWLRRQAARHPAP